MGFFFSSVKKIRTDIGPDGEMKLEHLLEQDGVYYHQIERDGECWERSLF